MKLQLLLFSASLLVLAACKKDRNVNCQYDIPGTYTGMKISTPYGQTHDTTLNVTVEARLKSGKLQVIFEDGEKTDKFKVDDCAALYKESVPSGFYSYDYKFYQDSMYIKVTVVPDSPSEENVYEYFVSKN